MNYCRFFKETDTKYFCTCKNTILGASDVHGGCWLFDDEESICPYYEKIKKGNINGFK